MAYTKYSLTPANNNATPPDGAPEGMLPSAVNDTMRDMMAQIRDCGDGIRNGTYTMTAPVITGGSITGASGSFTSLTDSGNLTFTGTGNRITGDMTNATLANRVAFQTSTSNTTTILSVIPNGTGTSSAIQFYNNSSDLANASVADFRVVGTTDVRLSSTYNGTGTQLPLTMYTGGSERLRIDTSGNFGIGTTTTNTGKVSIVTTTGGGNPALYISGNDQSNVRVRLNNSGASGTSFSIVGGTAGVSNLGLGFYDETNSATRMQISSGGDVGIGTTNPTQKLDVAGNITGNDYIIRATAGTIGYTGTNGAGIEIYSSSSGTPNILTLRTSNVERMRIDSSGNVGIGTNSPTSYSGFTTLAINNSSSGGLLDFVTNGIVQGQIFSTASEMRFTKIGANFTSFYTNGSERLRITSSGDVGIGTTNPGATGYTSFVALGNNNSGIGKAGTNIIGIVTANSERFRIDGEGNVSVVQSAGKYTCDVTGGATSVANNGTVDFSNASGMLVVNNHSTGGVTIYIMGGGITGAVSSVVGQVGTMTYVPGINGYRFTNNSGSTATFGFFFVRTRSNA